MHSSELKLLNIGCGNVYINGWVNCDVNGDGKNVLRIMAGDPLPFDDASFDFVYSSHLLEHLSRVEGEAFITDAFRILKPGGVIRVVVPDLENIATEYLRALSEVRNKSDEVSRGNYQWMLLELLDQMVRNKSGGDMLEYLLMDDLPNQSFIEQRVGSEALNIWRSRDKIKALIEDDVPDSSTFRNSYENHKWMYDSYSLGSLLIQIGFHDINPCSAGCGAIQGIELERLELEDNKQRKPDSLYMEGKK